MPIEAEGEFALIQDHLEQALRASTDPARWGSAATETDLYVSLADGAAEANEASALERYVPLALESAMRLEHQLYIGIAERAHGVWLAATGRQAESLESFNRALARFDDLGTGWQAGRTLVRRAQALVALARFDEARADRHQARELFAAVGARPAEGTSGES